MSQVRVLSPLLSGVAQSVERRYIMSLVLWGCSSVVEQRADNAEVGGSIPPTPTTMLENGIRVAASTGPFDQNQVIDGTWLNDYSSLR